MIPRVACFARNPGLGNRNSYRVAKDKPHPNLPQGEGAAPNHLKHSRNGLPPLGEGMGRGFWAGLVPLLLSPRPLNHLADMLGEMSVGR